MLLVLRSAPDLAPCDQFGSAFRRYDVNVTRQISAARLQAHRRERLEWSAFERDVRASARRTSEVGTMHTVDRLARKFRFLCSLAFLLAPSLASADHAPVIVVPGRAGVPVIINGEDVTGAIVEGDWGLERPGHGVPTVIPLHAAPLRLGPPPAAYYPSTGRRPAYGRREVEPPANRRLPLPAEPYLRTWGVQSDPTPATSPPPYDPPPVILAPRTNERHPGG